MPYFDANRNTVLTCYLTNDYRYTTVNSDTNIAVKDIYISSKLKFKVVMIVSTLYNDYSLQHYVVNGQM